jgi:putative toxin-antitoxin system antitoxin component (TIGR02293 family)
MYNVETVFGGPFILGRKAKNRSSFDEIIRTGIPLTAGENVKQVLQLTDKEFAEMIGVSLSSLLRMRKKQGKWSELASDRLFRLARIFAFAAEVMGSEDRARRWIRRPQIGLGGKIPLHLLETDAGAKDVENLLGQIKYGLVL